MKLVSFYFDIEGKTYYSNHAKRLALQCHFKGIDYDIQERHFGNSWVENINGKATYFKETLLRLKKPFVWIDVDCEVINIDFKVKGDWGFMLRPNKTPHVFVHYINYTENNLRFLDKYIALIEKNKNGDHDNFIELHKELNSFVIPEGHFKLGLPDVHIESRHKILTEKENAKHSSLRL